MFSGQVDGARSLQPARRKRPSTFSTAPVAVVGTTGSHCKRPRLNPRVAPKVTPRAVTDCPRVTGQRAHAQFLEKRSQRVKKSFARARCSRSRQRRNHMNKVRAFNETGNIIEALLQSREPFCVAEYHCSLCGTEPTYTRICSHSTCRTRGLLWTGTQWVLSSSVTGDPGFSSSLNVNLVFEQENPRGERWFLQVLTYQGPLSLLLSPFLEAYIPKHEAWVTFARGELLPSVLMNLVREFVGVLASVERAWPLHRDIFPCL